MKSTKYILAICLIASGQFLFAQKPINWTNDQLMQPSTLADAIQNHHNVPLIFSIGQGAVIPGSIAIGPVQQDANLAAFKKALDTLPKNAALVIYCGCCPFEHCPNVRPAIDLLKQMDFTNYKLLNLEHNVKADWLDKGYPKM